MNCVQGFPKAVRQDPTDIFSLMSHPFSRQVITIPTFLSDTALEKSSSRESDTSPSMEGTLGSLSFRSFSQWNAVKTVESFFEVVILGLCS